MPSITRQMRVVAQATANSGIQTRVAFFAADGVTPLTVGTATWDTLTGKPAVIGAGATATLARAAIGATDLILGTTSTTAAAGDQLVLKAALASPAFSGTPTVPTAAAGTNTLQAASTAFVVASYAPIASPTLTGTPSAPAPALADNTNRIATTSFVLANAGKNKTAIAALSDSAVAAGVAAAGANPTKAEYDALVLLVNDLKAKISSLNTALKA